MKVDFDVALTRPYQPTAIYNATADMVEYVRRDVTCIYRRIDKSLTLALDSDTREAIGFRIKGFKNIYLREVVPLLQRLRKQDFVPLISILERLVKDIGDDVFGELEREGYGIAREVACADNVVLTDLPIAA